MRKRGLSKKFVLFTVIILLSIIAVTSLFYFVNYLIERISAPLFSPPTTLTVESTGNAGLYSSIALDSNGVAHISEYGDSQLKYCNNTGGVWSCAIVTGPDIGYYSSIALDSNNVAHISSYLGGVGPKDLIYCNNSGGDWSCEYIDSANDVGSYSSIAIDSNNVAHISYYDATNLDLRYCNNIGGSWNCVAVDTTNDVGKYSSIAVDKNNVVHISEYEDTDARLRYCNNTGGTWSCVTVDIVNYGGMYSSIAIDSNNVVHISHYDPSAWVLRYCNNSAGTWSCVQVEAGGGIPPANVGLYSSIAIDANNKVHIPHYDDTNDDLRYCNNMEGSWSCTKLEDTGTSFGRDNGDRWLAIKKGRLVDSISFDTTAHMSWYNSSNGDLMYTTTSTISPRLGITLIEPQPPVTAPVDVTQNKLFNVKANVCCYDADCGDVDVSLFNKVAYLDPDGDISVNWEYPALPATHYTEIDDGIRQPIIPDTSDYVRSLMPSFPTDDYSMTTIAGVTSVSKVVIWAYGSVEAGMTISADIYMAGAWVGLVDFGFTTDGWKSATFEGTWTQADLDAMQVRIKTGGGLNAKTVYALYAEIRANILISTTQGDKPFYIASSNPTYITPSPSNPTRISLTQDECQQVTFSVNPTGNIGEAYTFFSQAKILSNPLIFANTQEWDVHIIAPIETIIKNLNIKDNLPSSPDLIVTPIAGENANVVISATVVDDVCQSFAVNAYLCDTILSTCSDTIYTYNIPLTYQSKVGSECLFSYTGNTNTPQFWKAPGTAPGPIWKLYVKGIGAITLENSIDFTYDELLEISYAPSGEIDFGRLNEQAWNEGKPSAGIELINHGNAPLTIAWQVSPFTCSLPCTTSWTPDGTDMEIDDDALRAAPETGLTPIPLSATPSAFNPNPNLAVCTSDLCNGVNEKLTTYYHLNPPNLELGDYENQITITLNKAP